MIGGLILHLVINIGSPCKSLSVCGGRTVPGPWQECAAQRSAQTLELPLTTVFTMSTLISLRFNFLSLKEQVHTSSLAPKVPRDGPCFPFQPFACGSPFLPLCLIALAFFPNIHIPWSSHWLPLPRNALPTDFSPHWFLFFLSSCAFSLGLPDCPLLRCYLIITMRSYLIFKAYIFLMF